MRHVKNQRETRAVIMIDSGLTTGRGVQVEDDMEASFPAPADEPIDQKYLDAGDWTVQIGDAVYPAVTSLRPLYDPASKRVQM